MRHNRVLCALAIAAVVVAGAGGPSAAADSGAKLQEVERALKKSRSESQKLKGRADKLAREAREAKRQLVEIARSVQNHEARLNALEGELAALGELETDLEADLERRRTQSVSVLMALQKMARHPPEALLVHTQDPEETVRTAIVLRAALPRIQIQAAGLREALRELEAARGEAAARRQDVARAEKGLESERQRLRRLLAKKSGQAKEARAASRKAARRAERLGREAKNLRELIAGLERDRAERERRAAARAAEEEARKQVAAAPPPAERPISKARGTLVFPVAGRVITRYGQATGDSITSKGLTIAARKGAQVVAPFDGRVAFAGPFRGYGQLLIIEHSEGYHTLLAGMDRINAVIGQWVLQGEPVAVMADSNTTGRDLYVELRRNSRPINPLPWLAARKGKVSG